MAPDGDIFFCVINKIECVKVNVISYFIRLRLRLHHAFRRKFRNATYQPKSDLPIAVAVSDETSDMRARIYHFFRGIMHSFTFEKTIP